MGRILIFNTGPNAHEAGGYDKESNQAGRIAPPEAWIDAALPRISEEKPAAVYYCDLPGAREYAQMICKHLVLEEQPLPGLEREIDPRWVGMTDRDHIRMQGVDAGEASAQGGTLLPFAADAGKLRDALASSLDGLARQHKREAILIVSHRMLTVLMALHLLHMGSRHYAQVAQEFGALNLFEVRAGTPSALYLNDTCHLHGLILG